MTDEQVKALKELIDTTEKYLPLIPDSVPECMRLSVAKYYPALWKLAQE